MRSPPLPLGPRRERLLHSGDVADDTDVVSIRHRQIAGDLELLNSLSRLEIANNNALPQMLGNLFG